MKTVIYGVPIVEELPAAGAEVAAEKAEEVVLRLTPEEAEKIKHLLGK